MPIETKANNSNIYRIAIPFLICALYYVFTYKKYDIAPSDEDVYLKSGLDLKLPLETFGNLLQSIGYFVTSKLSASILNSVYNYNYVVSVLVFLSLILFLYKFSKNYTVAVLISSCFLFSQFQISLQPRITMLNLFLGLLFMSLIDLKKPKYVNWGLMTICFLLCNYVSRPEFFILFVISFSIFIFQLFITKTINFQHKIFVFSLLLFLVALLYYVGGGIYDGGKLKIAFIQHFFDNHEIWTGEKFDYQEEFIIFEQIYGSANSNLELITVNPKLFFKHVFTNLYYYVVFSVDMFKSMFYNMFVPFFGNKTKYFVTAFLVVFLLLIDYSKTKTKLISLTKSYSKHAIFLGMFLVPSSIAISVVFPRDHYVLLHLPLYFLIIAILLSAINLKSVKNSKLIFSIYISVVAIGLMSISVKKDNYPKHKDFYEYMNSVGSKKKLKILSNDIFGFSFYAEHYSRKGWNIKTETILEKVKADSIDLVCLYGLDLEEKENRDFIKNEATKLNYVRIRTFESVNRYIWVKPELEHLFITQ